jgi:hypothetical protein
MTGRLVIVTNRVPDPRERGATAGGLAVALKDALGKRDALWFGWSGGIAAKTAAAPVEFRRNRTTYSTIDLGEADYRHYYQGFSNAALWPVLHYRLGLARFAREDWIGYRRVNAAFAAALAPLLRSGDTIWVQAGAYTELVRLDIPCGVNVIGAGSAVVNIASEGHVEMQLNPLFTRIASKTLGQKRRRWKGNEAKRRK